MRYESLTYVLQNKSKTRICKYCGKEVQVLKNEYKCSCSTFNIKKRERLKAEFALKQVDIHYKMLLSLYNDYLLANRLEDTESNRIHYDKECYFKAALNYSIYKK